MYVKVAETAIAAAVISSSIVSAIVSNGAPRAHAVMISVRWSVVCLIVCIISGLVAITGLSRGYDRAAARFRKTCKTSDYQDQGQLSDAELRLILVAGYFCLAGFLIGFLFLGRLAFQL